MSEVQDIRIKNIEDRVVKIEDNLDRYKTANKDSHERIYGRLEVMEKRDAITELQFKSIMEALDDVKINQREFTAELKLIKEKPTKRVDHFISAIIGAIAVGIVSFMISVLLK